MVNPIPKIVTKLWSIWNIRVIVLFSLFLQVVLILLAPIRKYSCSKVLAFAIWSAYVLADVIADYAIGLITCSQCSHLSNDDQDLILFWSAFLLVHLGGPDTITALALQDNELWLRHFLTLVFQVVTTLYLFLQSLPKNKLMIPMISMFVSGCIKYLERTRSLYVAKRHTFPDFASPSSRELHTVPDSASSSSSSSELDTVPDSALPISREIHTVPDSALPSHDESLSVRAFMNQPLLQPDDLQLVHAAYRCFRIFESRIVDQILESQTVDRIFDFRDEGLTLEILNQPRAAIAFKVIEVELNFMYDILFTKAMVVHSFMGLFFRFFSFCCLITSLAVFHFHITKHGVFNGINVAVTYALFLGAVALELIAFLMFVVSDWVVVAIKASEESPDQNWWTRIVAQVSKFILPAFRKIWSYWRSRWYQDEGAQFGDPELRLALLSWRWSGCLSGHNLIRYCLKGQPSGIHNKKSNLWVPIAKAISYAQLDWLIDRVGLRDLLDEMSCLSREPLRKDLWYLIFKHLEYKSHFANDYITTRKIASAKGEWVLQEGEDSHDNLKEYIDVPYDESLLLWHVATELLYNDQNNSGHRIRRRIRRRTNSGRDPEGYVEMSKTLSDYMLYLLIMQPDIMARVGGIGKRRFQHTCAVAKRFFVQEKLGPSQQVDACDRILDENNVSKITAKKEDERESVLLKASMLAKELRKLRYDRWELIVHVWVELLCHGASHGRGKALEQQLTMGGELITFVWLLMDHFGFRAD